MAKFFRCSRCPSIGSQAGYSLVELVIGIGLSVLVAVGGIQLYQRMQAQSERKQLMQSTVEEQRLLLEILKTHWDSKDLRTDCSARVAKLNAGCHNSWTNQSDFGFQIGTISSTSLTTAWVPNLQINYRLWTSDSNQVSRTMTLETKCKAAPVGIRTKLNNLLPAQVECRPCPSGQVPYVELADSSGSSRIFPPHLADTARMSFNKSLGMRICFKFHGHPQSYAHNQAQDPQLQIQLQSLLTNPAGTGIMQEVKTLSFPMLKPSTLKIERRVK